MRCPHIHTVGFYSDIKKNPGRNNLWKGRFILGHGLRASYPSIYHSRRYGMGQQGHFAEGVLRVRCQEAEGTEKLRLCYNLQRSTPCDLLPPAKLSPKGPEPPQIALLVGAKDSNQDTMEGISDSSHNRDPL